MAAMIIPPIFKALELYEWYIYLLFNSRLRLRFILQRQRKSCLILKILKQNFHRKSKQAAVER